MSKTLVYLGHYKEDIYKILAKEEVMHQWVAEKRIPLLMTCDVSKPAITIAEREDLNDIRVKRCLKDGVDFTRRLGGGSVIWLDDRMLLYFFVAPAGPLTPDDLSKFHLHQECGKKIALTLKMLGAKNVHIGERFSICLGRGPRYVISGNTVIIKREYFSYHGVLVLRKLNLHAIKKYIVLRKSEKLDEEEILASLPSLTEALGRQITAEYIASELVRGLTGGDFRIATANELRDLEIASQPFRDKYANHSWIFEPELVTKRNAGFCLIAFSESWDEKNFYPV